MKPGREFWELTDAEIWAEVDATWLLEQFRRSEVAERRERARAREFTRWGMTMGELRFCYQQLVEAVVRNYAACMAAAVDSFPQAPNRPSKPKRRRCRHAFALRIWHAHVSPAPRQIRSRNSKLPSHRPRRHQHRP